MSPADLVEEESRLAGIIRSMRTVAVVGVKDGREPSAPAYSIPAMLQARGYRVIPINPTIAETLGEPTLASVADLEEAVDVLDVFRRIEAIPALVDEILALPESRRPRVVWLQTGIEHAAAAARLAEAGIRVVQDRCLGVYVSRYR